MFTGKSEGRTKTPEMTVTLIQPTFPISSNGPENDWIPNLLKPKHFIKGGTVALSKEFPHMVSWTAL